MSSTDAGGLEQGTSSAAEGGNVNTTTRPRTEDERQFKGPKFDPPVYRQRYGVVEEMVNKYKAKKVRL